MRLWFIFAKLFSFIHRDLLRFYVADKVTIAENLKIQLQL